MSTQAPRRVTRLAAALVAMTVLGRPGAAQALPEGEGLFLQLGAGLGAAWLWHEDDGTETLASPAMGLVLGSAVTENVRVGLDFAAWSTPIGEPTVRSYNLGVRVELGGWKHRTFVGATAGASEYGGDLPYHAGGFVGLVAGRRVPLGPQASLSVELTARAQLYGDAVATSTLVSLTLHVMDRL